MTTRTVDQVGDWDSRPFSGGYRGLQDLSDEGFSGIVTAGPARLCMTKGKVVGVLDGGIEDFEGASGTVHQAPSPALPLLAVMQERSDEVRAQYYTEETPIAEVDRTLSDGNFTGYVELSENVLSGDYYVVYHQGRSMNVAWVGESGQLLTEDEAFERTEGEVGIYKVKPGDIDVIEIPEPAEPAPDDTEPTGADPSGTDAPDDDASETEPDGPAETDASAVGESESTPATDESRSRAGPSASPDASSAADADEPGEDGTGASDRQKRSGTQETRSERSGNAERRRGQDSAETASRTGGRSGASQQGHSPPASQSAERNAGQSQRPSEGPATGSAGVDARQREAAGASGQSDAVGGLETRSIPSLDPDRTSTPEDEDAADHGPEPAVGGAKPGDNARQQPGPAARQQSSEGASQGSPDAARAQRPPQESGRPQRGPNQDPHSRSGGSTASAEAGQTDVDRLEAELAEREEEIEELEAELDDVEGERDDLEAQLDDVKAERDELQDRVEQLERRVNELRTGEGGESVADRRRMSPGEVIDGTNLFVRYESKGKATLEAAYRGDAEPTAVNDNLDIQHHTQFDAEDVAVNGEPFTEFLHGTLQYTFVEWAIRVLPYEIRDTGHEGSLSDLYEALPEVDRAELNGTISVVYEEDGQEQRSQEQFDVVLRDRMGNPLAVANMNESRQPASQSMMESLITASQRVGESKESLAGAFLVTSSFFEPEAMEAAEDATGSGLLSRDKRASFVKLSRKDGFHLCLVQYLEGQFELSVPEL